MTQENPSSWLVAHLYYDEPWERLLTEAMLPYAEILVQTGIAQSWFFVRYWDRGPHIRLRIQAAPDIIEKMLRPNLEEHFLNYFDSVPSFRTDPPYPPGIPEAYKWLPNNSVQYDVYLPELTRYGGETGVALAEKQFALSSKIVLKHIEAQGQQWSYDDALGTAIKLHLSFLYAAGMDHSICYSFLEFFYQNWLPHAFSESSSTTDASVLRQKELDVIRQFDDAFIVQKRELLPFHKVLWRGLQQGISNFEDVLLEQWVNDNKLILEELYEAWNNKQLAERNESFAYQKTEQHPHYNALWDHYADYIHMTNNRLGIHNKDEGYLGYLMMRSMELISSPDEEDEEGSRITRIGKRFFISLD